MSISFHQSMKTNADTTDIIYVFIANTNFESRASIPSRCLLDLYSCPPTPSTRLSSVLLSSFRGRTWADSWPFNAHASHINTHSSHAQIRVRSLSFGARGHRRKALALTWCPPSCPAPHLKVSLLWPRRYWYGRYSRCREVVSARKGASNRYLVMQRIFCSNTLTTMHFFSSQSFKWRHNVLHLCRNKTNLLV